MVSDSTVVRVCLRYPDADAFVDKFSANVTRGGIFLPSRDKVPVDAVIRFEVTLKKGDTVFSGRGRVTWVKEYDPAQPSRPYGMGVQFISVDQSVRPILDRMLEQREGRASAATAPTNTSETAADDSSSAYATATSEVPDPAKTKPTRKPSRQARRTDNSSPTETMPRPPQFDEQPAADAQPAALAHAAGNGNGADLALERVLARARVLAACTDSFDALLRTSATEPASFEEALRDLPRLLGHTNGADTL
jgi:uncharacterized protein (TIGR02266 family)